MAPPERAKGVHGLVIARLQQLMAEEGIQMRNGDQGPCLLTVINSSRIEADISRDTKIFQGSSVKQRKNRCKLIFSDLGSTEQIIMILMPVMEVPSNHFSQLRSLDGKMARFRLVLEMYVDTNNRALFNCDHNSKQLKKIVEYFS